MNRSSQPAAAPGPIAGWAGWLRRPPGRWQILCTAATRGGAWDLLLARLPKESGSMQVCVLKEGERP